MRMFVLPVLGLVALAVPASAFAQGAGTPGCAVRVEFASYAMGIDRAAFDRVQALLKRDRGVRAVEVQRWGREGETNLCIQLRRPGDARRVFGRLKTALPAKPRGPITVEARGGLRFAAPKAE
ncbi:hypothetical protein ACCC88_12800 [Sphingomonas sp. Sphisp140]|uniref:hypothetical protein n=1 Tax=unclassified Sphingomonas TaxID=196159 RepID=UPI0039B08436